MTYNQNIGNNDPVLSIIKSYDLAIFHARKAREEWGKNESKVSLVNVEKALNRVSNKKLPMIPQLKPLYHYYHRLLIEAQRGNKKSLDEFLQHFEELKNTWVLARKLFMNKKSA